MKEGIVLFTGATLLTVVSWIVCVVLLGIGTRVTWFLFKMGFTMFGVWP
jgi:hypothetical protein